ncbi:RNA polymerase sigma factor [Emcibacter sp.]|uniref:RNA polymerase sigma factor n=1 Tax=Emcibacter sp. TaxID=1979954 RepID=UPI003A9349BA
MKKLQNSTRLETLFTGTYKKLHNYLRRMTLSEDEAEDALQETYERLMKASRTRDVIYNEAFVYRIARNVALNELRHKKIHIAAQPTLEHQIPQLHPVPADQALEAKQDLKLVLDAVNSLPPKCREVFYLRRVEQLSHKEIAEKVGISTKTVEKHIATGIRLTHIYFSKVRKGEYPVKAIKETGS